MHLKLFFPLFLLLKSSLVLGNSDFDQALKQYEKLHLALRESDLTQIQEESKKLAKLFQGISDPNIKKTLQFSAKKLKLMAKSEDMSEMRQSFHIISQALSVAIKKHSPNPNYARYYCPMVKKYWIQNISKSKKVLNPYAWKTMPHCGVMKKN